MSCCRAGAREGTSRTSAPSSRNRSASAASVCAPPDEEFAGLFARVGVTPIALGPSTRSIAAGLKAPSQDAASRLAAELVAARFATLPAAAEGCHAIVATGLMPAGARDVAESLGIRYVLATFHIFGLPSRHFAPAARPGKQSPAGETDNRVLWAQDAERVNALYAEPLDRGRAAFGLHPGRQRPRPRHHGPALAGRRSGPCPVEGADRPRHRTDGGLVRTDGATVAARRLLESS